MIFFKLNRSGVELLEKAAVPSPEIVLVRLAPGEAVLWQDERLLHGRRSFKANQSSDRLLWKAGIKLQLEQNG